MTRQACQPANRKSRLVVIRPEPIACCHWHWRSTLAFGALLPDIAVQSMLLGRRSVWALHSVAARAATEHIALSGRPAPPIWFPNDLSQKAAVTENKILPLAIELPSFVLEKFGCKYAEPACVISVSTYETPSVTGPIR
jgi:hypothetical protein